MKTFKLFSGLAVAALVFLATGANGVFADEDETRFISVLAEMDFKSFILDVCNNNKPYEDLLIDAAKLAANYPTYKVVSTKLGDESATIELTPTKIEVKCENGPTVIFTLPDWAPGGGD
jgi:hypothetical protein